GAPSGEVIDGRDGELVGQPPHQHREDGAEPDQIGPELTPEEALRFVGKLTLQDDDQQCPGDDESGGNQRPGSYQPRHGGAPDFPPPAANLTARSLPGRRWVRIPWPLCSSSPWSPGRLPRCWPGCERRTGTVPSSFRGAQSCGRESLAPPPPSAMPWRPC